MSIVWTAWWIFLHLKFSETFRAKSIIQISFVECYVLWFAHNKFVCGIWIIISWWWISIWFPSIGWTHGHSGFILSTKRLLMVIRFWVMSCRRIEMWSFFQSSTKLHVCLRDAEGLWSTLSDLTINFILPRCWVSICFPFIWWTQSHVLFDIWAKRSQMVIVKSCWVISCWWIKMWSFFQPSSILHIRFWDAKSLRLTFGNRTIKLILSWCWIVICLPFIWWTHSHILFQVSTEFSLMVIRFWVSSGWRIEMWSFFQSSSILHIGFWDAKSLRLTFGNSAINFILSRSWIAVSLPFIRCTQCHGLFQFCSERSLMVISSWVSSGWRIEMWSFF